MIVGLGIRLKIMSPRGGHHLACLEILGLQWGCSSKEQIWVQSPSMSLQMPMAPCVLQLFFLPVFCWLCCILVPSFHLLQRQGDRTKTSPCQPLLGCTYPSLFHLVGIPLPGTPQCWPLFHSHSHWLAEVRARPEHPHRPLPLSMPQSLPLSRAHRSPTTQFTHEAAINRICLPTGTVGAPHPPPTSSKFPFI